MTQNKWNAKQGSTEANALTIPAGVPQIPLDASTWDPTTTLDLLQQMSTALRVLLSLSRNTQQAPAVFVLMAVCLDCRHTFTFSKFLGNQISNLIPFIWQQARPSFTPSWRSWSHVLLESLLLSYLAWVMLQTLPSFLA